jgi:transposase InsO family protein
MPGRKGGRYTSMQFRALLTSNRMRPSAGRVGSCFDNAAAKSFFASLKAEIGTRGVHP